MKKKKKNNKINIINDIKVSNKQNNKYPKTKQINKEIKYNKSQKLK